MIKNTLLIIALLFVIAGCSTAQIIDIREGDASISLGQLDAEAQGVPGMGARIELNGCILILRNFDKLLQEGASSDEVLGSIKMKTPTCEFGGMPGPTGTLGIGPN